MSETKVSIGSSGGIGFTGLLTLIFITLKLTNVIDWSWFWVLAPLWISALIVILILFLIVMVLAIGSLFT